ncbi:hypothetical protein NPIL_112771 [Nephila pilipes]|uniref:Uncharacterized protein n=1 Tax=Nephila pilipes TaxID=299642 RepID=A0A8X6NKQ2_NEPPI|nr:hypothetical protein NPIL_112771 [Nephila pilipes]
MCNSHFKNKYLYNSPPNPYRSENPPPSPPYCGVKIKASEKKRFKSPTKTSKQPRKDPQFQCRSLTLSLHSTKFPIRIMTFLPPRKNQLKEKSH